MQPISWLIVLKPRHESIEPVSDFRVHEGFRSKHKAYIISFNNALMSAVNISNIFLVYTTAPNSNFIARGI